MILFLAILSHLGWAIGNVFGVSITRKVGAYAFTFWEMSFTFILTLCLLPLFYKEFFLLTPLLFIQIIALSILLLVGRLAFNEGMQKGNPSLVGVISASFAAVSVIFSIIFLGEQLSLERGIIITIILLGVALCVIGNDFRLNFGRGEAYGLLACLSFGIYYAFIKIPIAQVGWFVPGFIFLALFPLVGGNIRLKGHAFHNPFQPRLLFLLIASTLLIAIAEFSFNIAMSIGSSVAFFLPIAGSYPALFVVLSSFIFKEKVLRHQWIGIGMALIGIVALSV